MLTTTHYPHPKRRPGFHPGTFGGARPLCGDGLGRGDSIYASENNCDTCKKLLAALQSRMQLRILRVIASQTKTQITERAIIQQMIQEGYAMIDREVTRVLSRMHTQKLLVPTGGWNPHLALTPKGHKIVVNSRGQRAAA